MVDQLASLQENRDRIQVIESLFRLSGKPLNLPGRVLVGEGCLTKLCRRRPQTKVFYLFNDVLVYGSIILHGRWHKNQKIIPLENIQLEDLEDGFKMKNQWLIRTTRKSFYVSASSPAEKQAWFEHIEDCRSKRLSDAGQHQIPNFAVTWIPNQASAVCMRCTKMFTFTQRRHHCRHCGFVVCNNCSKFRAVIAHIKSTKSVRVCKLCHIARHSWTEAEERSCAESDGTKYSSSDDISAFLENEPHSEKIGCRVMQSPYVYFNSNHQKLTQQQI